MNDIRLDWVGSREKGEKNEADAREIEMSAQQAYLRLTEEKCSREYDKFLSRDGMLVKFDRENRKW